MLPAPPPDVRGLDSPPSSAAAVGAPSPAEPGHAGRFRAPRRSLWIVAGAAVAGCAYVAIVDPNAATSWYPECPFKALTGWDCPGCGVTRAVHAALTGHPLRALDHNVLVVVAAVLAAIWFGVGWLRRRQGRPPVTVRHPTAWAIAVGLLVLTFWVVRNIPWGPLRWLGSGAAGA